jgi:hypothetical protein
VNKQTKEALVKFREKLSERLIGLHCDAAIIKGDEIVDDNACDSVVWGAQEIAEAFNEVASLLGLEPVEVPADLEKSPYQEDEEEDDDE